jgi:putative NADPH-quinone reductase
MKVLILQAHPEPASFNGALRNAARVDRQAQRRNVTPWGAAVSKHAP